MKIPLRYPGSKQRISEWIINQMPRHHSYLEPYFGGGAVLFNKSASKIETINDLDDDVINLFKIIRERPEELCRMVECTPYARAEYENSFLGSLEDLLEIERARRFLVRSWQGYGFRICEKTGWKRDVYAREAAYAVKSWREHLPKAILQAALRLKDVQVEHRPALELIKAFNHNNVLIYADPPYLLSTRCRKQYRHEMTDVDHIELLEALLQHTGSVMISGYDNDIYNSLLSGWRREQLPTLAEGGRKRIETLWMNF